MWMAKYMYMYTCNWSCKFLTPTAHQPTLSNVTIAVLFQLIQWGDSINIILLTKGLFLSVLNTVIIVILDLCYSCRFMITCYSVSIIIALRGPLMLIPLMLSTKSNYV